jgi:hypothetical protein
MPAALSLWIKERYMARRAAGPSQQVLADALWDSVRSAQRIDWGDLQTQDQQQRGRHWPTRAHPLAAVWESGLVPMLKKAPQLEFQTLLLRLLHEAQLPWLTTLADYDWSAITPISITIRSSRSPMTPAGGTVLKTCCCSAPAAWARRIWPPGSAAA